jgi:hypothetical protein
MCSVPVLMVCIFLFYSSVARVIVSLCACLDAHNYNCDSSCQRHALLLEERPIRTILRGTQFVQPSVQAYVC